MPLSAIPQPEIIEINENLRLRRYDGHYERFLPPYQNPYVYQNSEGIFDDAKKLDLDYVKRMCSYLDRTGEFYYIEAKENDTYICIGDLTAYIWNLPSQKMHESLGFRQVSQTERELIYELTL